MTDHPWQSSSDEFFNEFLPKLEARGHEIGAKLETSETAKEIVKFYGMLHRSFDPMTFTLLKEKFAQYEKENGIS